MTINPESWFLDASRWQLYTRELTGGKPYTSHNKITPLIDAQDYFKALYDDLALLRAAARPGDYVFIAGWNVSPDVVLDPANAADSRLRPLLGGLVKDKKVDVRILMASGVYHNLKKDGNDPSAFYSRKKGLAAVPSTYRDSRVPLTSSQHQNAIVIRQDQTIIAYVGSIDLSIVDRYDGRGHGGGGAGRARYPGGWHDVAVKLEGPAAWEVDRTFRDRWKNKTPLNYTRDERARYEKDPIASMPPPVPVAAAAQTHHVQVLRTLAKEGGLYDFAKEGDLTAAEAWKKAVQAAKKLIYIEDALFVGVDAARWLGEQLKAAKDLRVIAVVPRKPEVEEPRFAFWQQEAVKALLAAADAGLAAGAAKPSDRFAIYHLESTGTPRQEIFCHAALTIVDDAWASVGSMNLGRRSMTASSELCVAFCDSEEPVPGASKAVLDLRLSLWKEHLALTGDDDLKDPAKGFDTWKSRAGTPPALAVAHAPKGSMYDAGTYNPDLTAWDGVWDRGAANPLGIALTSTARPGGPTAANPLVQRNIEIAQRLTAEKSYFAGDGDVTAILESLMVSGSAVVRSRSGKGPIRMCLAPELIDVISVLLATSQAKTARFELISLARHPLDPHGEPNHALKLTQQTLKDANGEVIQGLCRGLDISGFAGYPIKTQFGVPYDPDEPDLSEEDQGKLDTLKANVTTAVTTLLGALPTDGPQYDIGLPGVAKSIHSSVAADNHDRDRDPHGAGVLTLFLPIDVDHETDGKSKEEQAKVEALQKELRRQGKAVHSRFRAPFGSTARDLEEVVAGSREALRTALQPLRGKVLFLFPENNDHLHLTVRLANEPVEKRRDNPAWRDWISNLRY